MLCPCCLFPSAPSVCCCPHTHRLQSASAVFSPTVGPYDNYQTGLKSLQQCNHQLYHHHELPITARSRSRNQDRLSRVIKICVKKVAEILQWKPSLRLVQRSSGLLKLAKIINRLMHFLFTVSFIRTAFVLEETQGH